MLLRRPSRRTFLRASIAALGSTAATGLYAWRVEPHWVEFVERDLPVARLPDGLAGRTLVQLSDIHVGPRVDDAYVIDTFERVTALSPDIVVVTGDFISYSSSAFEQMAAVYKHFPTGRLATLAVLGNHDYGVNWSNAKVAARVVDIAKGCGV